MISTATKKPILARPDERAEENADGREERGVLDLAESRQGAHGIARGRNRDPRADEPSQGRRYGMDGQAARPGHVVRPRPPFAHERGPAVTIDGCRGAQQLCSTRVRIQHGQEQPVTLQNRVYRFEMVRVQCLDSELTSAPAGRNRQ